MESINQPVANKKMGHTRRQSYGKIMPISSLLNNLIGPSPNFESPPNAVNTSTVHDQAKMPLTRSFETMTLNSRVNERSDGDGFSQRNVTNSSLDFINNEKMNETKHKQVAPQTVHAGAAAIDEVNVERTFLKCVNYHAPLESEFQTTTTNVAAKTDAEDNIDRLLGENDGHAPCLICTNKDMEPLKHSLMNVLCKKLCDESCNTSTKTCQSNDDIVSQKSGAVASEHDSDSTAEADVKFKSQIPLQRSSSSRQEFLASMLESEPKDAASHSDDKANVAPLTMENLKQFNDDYYREKLAIAEALANTSMMTSSAAKNRLAARKIEMSLNTPDFVYDPENAEYIPPRDLLMYLVRMGSFNSAPKINNIDSQDDDVEMPNGLETAADLVNHCKLMRGDNRPELLQRSFFKPINDLSMNDVTDGLRYLHLNSVSKVCSSPKSSPNHVRILQWNILSQSLGQHNDNFVCCPADALTWESRKYLIVQEIIQNDPDVICLQEVDHFKFLQTILATQNYEGIFFPKPDSPCLYIIENNGPDGCALFYKKNKFDLVNYDTRVLEVWRVQSNQVTIMANLRVIETGKEICVCTTHLKARNGALLAKLRNEQGKDLMRCVQRVAGNRPILISGDFNAEPIEPVYSTVINFEPLKLSSAYADMLASISSNSTDEKDGEHATNETNGDDTKNGDGVSNGDGINNGLDSRLEHLINHEPPYTTWKIREDGEVCHTIDYVFYSRDKLKVNNCLRFPLGNEIGKNRTPSHRYPSDHFSLLCDFEILDNDGENNGDGDLTNNCL